MLFSSHQHSTYTQQQRGLRYTGAVRWQVALKGVFQCFVPDQLMLLTLASVSCCCFHVTLTRRPVSTAQRAQQGSRGWATPFQTTRGAPGRLCLTHRRSEWCGVVCRGVNSVFVCVWHVGDRCVSVCGVEQTAERRSSVIQRHSSKQQLSGSRQPAHRLFLIVPTPIPVSLPSHNTTQVDQPPHGLDLHCGPA